MMVMLATMSDEISEVAIISIERVEIMDMKRKVLKQQISNYNMQKSDLGWGIYCVQPNANENPAVH